MKKILSIALIAALAVCSVFATSFKGSAAIELGYDLDTKDYGFANKPSTELKFGFELESGNGGKAGEKDLRAEIAGEFKVEFKENKYTETGDLKAATISTLKISKANILYKDILTVGILGPGKSADYASSYNVNDKGETLSDLIVGFDGKEFSAIDPTFSNINGFTVEAYGVKGGFGLNGNATEKASWFEMLAHAALTDKVLADGLKLSVGAAAEVGTMYEETATCLQFNVKGDYVKDELSVTGAVDFGLGLTTIKDVETEVELEASAAAKYDFVTANFYMYSLDKFENTIVDAKVAAEKTFDIEEGISVTANGSFEANNIADKTRDAADKTSVNKGKQEFTIAAGASATVDAFTFGLDASYGFKGKELSIAPSVKYKHEMFTASLSGKFTTVIETEKSNVLSIKASITSDKVIDGATLALTYDKASYTGAYMNLLKDQTKEQSLGKITASATVKF